MATSSSNNENQMKRTVNIRCPWKKSIINEFKFLFVPQENQIIFEYSLTPAWLRQELIWPPKHIENKQHMIKYSRFQIQCNERTVDNKMIVEGEKNVSMK